MPMPRKLRWKSFIAMKNGQRNTARLPRRFWRAAWKRWRPEATGEFRGGKILAIIFSVPNVEEPNSPKPNCALLRQPFLWLLLLLALSFGVPFIPIASLWAAAAGSVLLTVVYVAVVLLFVVSVARLDLPVTHLLALGLLAGALWVLLDRWLGEAITAPIIAALRETKTRPNFVQTLQILAVSTFTDLTLLVGAVCFGNIASRLLKTPNMLGPVCAVIALIDIWGVLFGGIVAQLMEKTPEIAARAMTQGPQVGAATASAYAIPMPHIGVGDYLFLGLLFGALVRNDLNWRAAMYWTVPLVCGALLAITFGFIPALPGLLFIALGVAIPNWSSFRYTREEKFALLYAGGFVAVLTIALYFGFTSLLPESKS